MCVSSVSQTAQIEQTSQQLLVVAGILWRGEELLLAVQRPVGRRHAGMWEFPGGKVELGEALETALARELFEELGITLRVCSPWKRVVHEYPGLTVDLRFFHVTAFDGEPKPNEGQILRWVTPDEAQTLPFLPPDKPLLVELIKKRDEEQRSGVGW